MKNGSDFPARYSDEEGNISFWEYLARFKVKEKFKEV
jgi:hypothetical protein